MPKDVTQRGVSNAALQADPTIKTGFTEQEETVNSLFLIG